jgi:hypothetical protein
VQSGDSEFLASDSDILGSQHGSVWAGFVTIGLDFHTTSNSADGFATRKIGDMDESVVL